MASVGMPESSPEYLVLPTMDSPPHDGSTIEVALLPVTGADGREQLAALAFTSVSLLVEAMGEEQPWAVLPAGEVPGALAGSGAKSVLVDPRPGVGAHQEASNG
ncbi:SAV_915 family protein [Streptomyces sp. NPDC086080]|uniref:SAV_915 family protein n=1 Tax=Streptomyces sp. NPDC086080 TaxID=3365748 RepID=UPI0037D33D7D